MIIKNVESLPHGLNAKYLEVIVAHNGDLVAYAWRRTVPKNMPKDHKLIVFSLKNPFLETLGANIMTGVGIGAGWIMVDKTIKKMEKNR